MILPKGSLKLRSSTCSSFWLTTYLYLTPLLTIFQLYLDSQFFGGVPRKNQRPPASHWRILISHNVAPSIPRHERDFNPICADYIGSFKFNQNTITTTTAPTSLLYSYAIITCIVGTVGWLLDVCISHYRWVTAVRLPRFKLHIHDNIMNVLLNT
jgi:hypothetical protein